MIKEFINDTSISTVSLAELGIRSRDFRHTDFALDNIAREEEIKHLQGLKREMITRFHDGIKK